MVLPDGRVLSMIAWCCVKCKRPFALAQAKWGCPYCSTSEQLQRNAKDEAKLPVGA